MDPRMLDGNSVAGLLREVFAVEMTTATAICRSCGATEAVGAVHVFRGAGVVLRCPHCENVLAKIVSAEGRTWIGFEGMQALQIASSYVASPPAAAG